MTIRLLVADDHTTFLRTLTTILRGAGLDVVATATSGSQAIQLAMQHQPDVVIMDVNMPGIDGIEATRRIVDAAPHIGVVVLTMFDEDESVLSAIRVGARGYLVKGAGRDEVVRAVEAAARGEAVFGAAAARRLRTAVTPQPVPAPAFPGLTSRELEVLGEAAAGSSTAEIGRRLGLSDKTVRNHLSAIYAKLGVSSRSEAIVRARQEGLGSRQG